MLTIDASVGEGGGRELRLALALALAAGAPVRLKNIRASRPQPGLLRRHLAWIRAAELLSRASADGAGIGSRELVFRPGPVAGGEFQFELGASGNVCLAFLALVPALLRAGGVTELRLVGVTHQAGAPSFEFLERAWLPLVRSMGASVELELGRVGFPGSGGGWLRARVEPAVAGLTPLRLLERGALVQGRARALISHLGPSIGERELRVVERELGWERGWSVLELGGDSLGPGNVLDLELRSERVTELIGACGERGVLAETIAEGLAERARRYLDSGAAVGPELAEHLLPALALAGGGALTVHGWSGARAAGARLIEKFLDVELSVEPLGENVWRLELGP